MLRISKLADYATVILCTLAERQDQMTASEIAAQTHIRGPTVSKILKTLAKQGLLQSSRGSRGGYGLSFPSSKITLSQVVRA